MRKFLLFLIFISGAFAGSAATDAPPVALPVIEFQAKVSPATQTTVTDTWFVMDKNAAAGTVQTPQDVLAYRASKGVYQWRPTRQTLGVGAAVLAAAQSADRSLLAIAGAVGANDEHQYSRVALLNLYNGQLIDGFTWSDGLLTRLVFCGDYLVGTGMTGRGPVLVVWSVAGGQPGELFRRTFEQGIADLAVFGHFLAVKEGDQKLHLLEITDNGEVLSLQRLALTASGGKLAFSPDGKQLVNLSSNFLEICRLSSGNRYLPSVKLALRQYYLADYCPVWLEQETMRFALVKRGEMPIVGEVVNGEWRELVQLGNYYGGANFPAGDNWLFCEENNFDLNELTVKTLTVLPKSVRFHTLNTKTSGRIVWLGPAPEPFEPKAALAPAAPAAKKTKSKRQEPEARYLVLTDIPEVFNVEKHPKKWRKTSLYGNQNLPQNK